MLLRSGNREKVSYPAPGYKILLRVATLRLNSSRRRVWFVSRVTQPEACAGILGECLRSGYRSALYDAAAKENGWHRRDFPVANHAADGTSKRRMTECVWYNFTLPADRRGTRRSR